MSNHKPDRAQAAALLAAGNTGYILVLDSPDHNGITMMASADPNTIATAALGLIENIADDLSPDASAHFLGRVASLLHGGPKHGMDGPIEDRPTSPTSIEV